MAAADTAEPRASAPPAPGPESRDIAELEREVRDAHHRWLALFHGPDFCLCWSGGRDAAAAAVAARDPDRWEAMVRARTEYQDAVVALACARARETTGGRE